MGQNIRLQCVKCCLDMDKSRVGYGKRTCLVNNESELSGQEFESEEDSEQADELMMEDNEDKNSE